MKKSEMVEYDSMPGETITLSSESIIDLAHNAMVPYGTKCEWVIPGKTCPVLLGCWELLKQHYLRHCKMQKKQHGVFYCSLPRCNAHTHRTLESLCDHVERAHMSRVPFPCPLNGCQSSNFTNRSNSLPDHFLAEHGELNGSIIQLFSDALRPSWHPFSPSLPPPPKLPAPGSLHPGCVVIMPSSSMRKKFPSSSFSFQPLSPRKPQRQIPLKNKAEEQEEHGLQVPEFETLPRYDTCHQPQDVVVWRRPAVLDMNVSQPQHMYNSPVGDAPISILYEVFAKKVDALEQNI